MDTDLEKLIQSAADPIVRNFLLMGDDSEVAVLPFALAIAARLGLADACGISGRTSQELAVTVGLAAESLSRLLKALASAGFFEVDACGRFTPTPLGAVLSADSPVSMRATLANTDSQRYWVDAIDSAAHGQPIIDAAFAEGYFGHKERYPAAGAAFNTRMRERATRLYLGLADLPLWEKTRCVLDVGGGTGTVLAACLRTWPRLKGILFDKAAVIDAALVTSTFDLVSDRVAFVAGDAFKELPKDADTHLLCSVLHDWSDARAIDILRASAEALAPGGRVLVCEILMPEEPNSHPAHWSDLGMMVMLGGQERTKRQFADLFRHSGLCLTGVWPLQNSPFALIEARPRT